MFYKKLADAIKVKIEDGTATARDIEIYLVITTKLFYFENS